MIELSAEQKQEKQKKKKFRWNQRTLEASGHTLDLAPFGLRIFKKSLKKLDLNCGFL